MSQKDTQFKPGQSGNPKGRPPGSHDKHFVRVETWLARYFEDLEDLPQAERLVKMEGIIEKFFSKIQMIPATPGESALNAAAQAQASAAQKLAAAENYGQQRSDVGAPGTGSGDPAVHVGTGPAQGQAPA